jgi:hypothetical protein
MITGRRIDNESVTHPSTKHDVICGDVHGLARS